MSASEKLLIACYLPVLRQSSFEDISLDRTTTDQSHRGAWGFRVVVGAELIAVDRIVDRIALAIVQREEPASP